MEKLIREVAMNIRYKDGADPVRVNVQFDLSDLTREQLADWCVNASSLRVSYQNRERPKGLEHLKALSKTTQKVKVQPCGSRTPAQMSESAMMALLLERKLGDAFGKYIAKYDSVEDAFLAYFSGKDEE